LAVKARYRNCFLVHIKFWPRENNTISSTERDFRLSRRCCTV